MTYGVEGVDVRFARVRALRDVTLAVPAGSIIAVVGGDGAGKTTLLRTLVGVVRPERGTVRRAARHDLGYLPARAGLYPDLTVRENVAFVGAAFGLRRVELERRSAPLLLRTGLADVTDRLAGALSGGMARKLALALALLPAPRLLVLDEPTTGIDPVSRGELWRLIAGAAAEDTAVVLSTTYLAEAERAEHVLVLADGAELVSGSPDDVIAAMPGRLGRMRTRPVADAACWRRGVDWRVWASSGVLPADAVVVDPDLEDAVTVAALAGECRGGATA